MLYALTRFKINISSPSIQSGIFDIKSSSDTYLHHPSSKYLEYNIIFAQKLTTIPYSYELATNFNHNGP